MSMANESVGDSLPLLGFSFVCVVFLFVCLFVCFCFVLFCFALTVCVCVFGTAVFFLSCNHNYNDQISYFLSKSKGNEKVGQTANSQ